MTLTDTQERKLHDAWGVLCQLRDRGTEEQRQAALRAIEACAEVLELSTNREAAEAPF